MIGRKGAVGSTHLELGPCWPIDTVFYAQIPDELSAKYLAYQLLFLRLKRLDSSTALPSLRREDLEAQLLQIAPMAEQHRIVAAIDEQFSRIDAAVSSLQRVRQNLTRIRAAVLQAAVSGRLVPQDPRDEPASLLVDAIRSRRRVKTKFKFARSADTSGMVAPLPPTWVWTTIGELFEVYVGSTPSRKNASFWHGDIPWVSSGEVAFNRIRLTRETISGEALGNPNTRLHRPGTVMLAMIGEGRTRGQAAILDVAAAHNQNCASIRVSATEMLPEYVYWALVERYERTRVMASGGNQPALNGDRVRAITLPVPPVPEQHRIVAAIDARETILQALNRALEAVAPRASAVRSSILSTAFSGKLVPQDPNDEPASVLLERIATARGSGTVVGSTPSSHSRVFA
jgi:type I restriction enzyme S subunit